MPKKKPHWTEEELAILTENYNRVTKNVLLQLLPNRTWRAITDKAKSLHIYRYRKYPRWGYPTDYKPIKLEMTPEQKAYVAGIVDGEGSILMLSTHYGTKYNPTVVISNCDRKLMDYLHKIIKLGKVRTEKKKEPRRTQYKLIIGTHLEIFSFLKEIKKFLVSKKELASLMIKYCRSRLDRGLKRGRNIIYTEEETEIAERIRALNDLSHRGDWKRKIKQNMQVLRLYEK